MHKKFIGAHLEVLSIKGDCVTCLKVTRRKMIINLRDALPGTYLVRLKKNGITEKLQFARN